MAVGLKLGSITDEVGTGDFFHSFFSTISGNLEAEGWGTRFPVLLNGLYRGQLHQRDAAPALAELDAVEKELARLPPAKVIWDIEDRSKAPPWGTKISSDITDMSKYFVTSTGRELIPVIRECLEELRDVGGVLKVVTY
jgi:2,3-bisphosphoglycerate-dependent phosphoglycerate mutase